MKNGNRLAGHAETVLLATLKLSCWPLRTGASSCLLEPLSLRTLKNVSLNRSRRLGLLGRPLLAFYRANALDLALAIS